MPPPNAGGLADRIASAGLQGRWLWDGRVEVDLPSAVRQSRIGPARDELLGRHVLIRTSDQIRAALALIELDGVAARLILCPPDLAERDLPSVIDDAEVDAIVGDVEPPAGLKVDHHGLSLLDPGPKTDHPPKRTDWIMFTSGTTGRPKMVVHTLPGLAGAIAPSADPTPPIWGTFYDIRRYGGLQMLLRACLGGGSMVLSQPDEAVAAFLTRLGSRGVTHLSATPSHWRKALMSPAIREVRPRYVRLSGEIADQSVLDRLQAAFPNTPVGHAYASTEAGVGFEVNDGREGFPISFVGREPPAVEMKVVDGSLRLRSSRTASRYLGSAAEPLAGPDGFVDTGDMVEPRGERYYFVGRRGGIINVGGLKIHPEEVEAVINGQPGVRMSLVKARRSPVTGAVVVADVVSDDAVPQAQLRENILAACRAALPPFKTPAVIRFVDALTVTPGGKLERPLA